jgi:hypothetical protein
MPLQARIGADFGDFRKALGEVKADLSNFGSTVTKLQGDLQRAVADLGGDKIRREAELIREAVSRIGGASKLTADEQARVNRVVTDALAKYRALGMQAPADLVKLKAATDDAARASSGLIGRSEQLVGMVARYAGAAAVGAAIRGTVAWADSVDEASKSVGMGAEAFQRLSYAMNQNGVTTERMTAFMGTLANRIAEGDASAAGALDQLGIAFESFRALKPEERFQAIAAATEASSLSTDELTAAYRDLYGGGAEQLIPALGEINEHLKQAPALTDAEIKKLAELQSQFDGLIAKGRTFIAEVLVKLFSRQGLIAGAVGGGQASQIELALDWWAQYLTSPIAPARAGSNMAGGYVDMRRRATRGGIGLPPSPELAERLMAEAEREAERRKRIEEQAAKKAKEAWDEFWDDLRKRSKEASDVLLSEAERYFSYLRREMWASRRQSPTGDLMTPSMALLTVPGGGLDQRWAGYQGGFGGWETGRAGTPEIISDQAQLNALYTRQIRLSLQNAAIQQGQALLDQQAAQNPYSKGWGALAGAGKGANIGRGLAAGTPFEGLSTAAGAGIGAIWGAVAAGKKEYGAVKEQRAAFEAQFGGVEKMMAAVQKAYADLGLSSAHADAAIKRLWDAKSVKAYEQAVADINKKLDEAAKKQATLGDIEALRQQIDLLKKDAVPSWQEMASIAEKYGIDVSVLGKSYQQLRITDLARSILSDFARLEAGGVAWQDILNGTQDEINDLVRESQKFGTTIPENMRPMIDAMIRQGLLLDDNGKKITDINALSFGEAVKTDTELLTEAIKDLVDKLEKLLKTVEEFPTAAPWHGWETAPIVPGHGGDGGMPPAAHRGGFAALVSGRPAIVAHGGLGPDEIPAILQTGEAVLSRRGVRTLGASLIRAANTGLSSSHAGAVAVNISVQAWDAASVQEWLDRGGDRIITEAVLPALPKRLVNLGLVRG